MRFISFVAIALTLAGCATQRDTIALPLLGGAPSLVVSDERPDEEKIWKSRARCTAQGKWTGLRDDAFEQPRPGFLAARLGAAFGDRISKVSLRHFQNCVQFNSDTSSGALAAFSVPLAIVVDSMMVKGKDRLLTYIAVAVDGKEYTATDTRTFFAKAGLRPAYFEVQTAADITSSTEAAIEELIRKISADLQSNSSRTSSGEDKTPR